MFARVNLIIDHSVRALCTLPYPGHEQGCPHYGKRDICPPNAPLFDVYFDLCEPVYAIWIAFDLARHIQKMKVLHPDWSEARVKDWNLWNAETKAALDNEIARFRKAHPNYTIVHCPEAMGVNITETAKGAGIQLEWQQPVSIFHRVALAGVRKTQGV